MKKEQLSKIMHTAWAVVKKEGVSISAALRMAWRSFKLAAKMKTKAVHFAFRKVDGTIREAVGTLADEFIKDREPKGDRARCYSVQTYFDIEKNEFRCFRIASLLA